MAGRFSGVRTDRSTDQDIEHFIDQGAQRQGSTALVPIAEKVPRTAKPKKQVQKVLVSFPVSHSQLLGMLSHLPVKCTQSEIVTAALEAFSQLDQDTQVQLIRNIQDI